MHGARTTDGVGVLYALVRLRREQIFLFRWSREYDYPAIDPMYGSVPLIRSEAIQLKMLVWDGPSCKQTPDVLPAWRSLCAMPASPACLIGSFKSVVCSSACVRPTLVPQICLLLKRP